MISTLELIDYIRRIGLEAASELVKIYEMKPLSRIIIPQKRDGSYRLSEQEFRVTSINAIQMFESQYPDLYYSVETPSTETHMISGKTPISARFDMSLYQKIKDTFHIAANIEFKSHNARIDSIKKDLNKLIKDGNVGAWFHVLKNCDSGTFKSLFDKFVVSLEELTQAESLGLKPTKDILFIFLVVEQRIMISKILSPTQLVNSQHYLEINNQQMLDSLDGQEVDGWLIYKL